MPSSEQNFLQYLDPSYSPSNIPYNVPLLEISNYHSKDPSYVPTQSSRVIPSTFPSIVPSTLPYLDPIVMLSLESTTLSPVDPSESTSNTP